MNNNNNRFLSLTVIFFLPLRLPRQSYNYYVLLLLLSSHTHYSLSLSCLTTRQTSPTHTHKLGDSKSPRTWPTDNGWPLLNYTHTRIFKKNNNYGRRNIESKVIPPHHLISICQSFFSTSLNLSKKGTSFSFFLSKWKGAPLLFVLVRVWWPGHVPL